MKNVSRREFLKKTAVGMIGVGGALTVGSISLADDEKDKSVIVNAPEKWDYECDVVTIGTGTSMYGAVKLAHDGLDVICVDAFSVAGGSASFSGGAVWLPTNPFARELGDSREKAFQYIKLNVGTAHTTDDMIYAYVDNVNPMLEFINPILEETSLKLKAEVFPLCDYNPEWENAMANGRALKWYPGVESKDATRAWADGTIEAFERFGGRIMTSTKMTKFVYRYDETGVPEVLGIICETRDGEIAIKARRAVFFAPGGFEWNFELQRRYSAIPDSYPCSTSTNDGTAFSAVLALGPMLNNMANHFGHLCYKKLAVEQYEKKSPVNMAWSRMKPHTIIVNDQGKRFFNESVNYAMAQKVFYNKRTDGGIGCENLPAWLITDHQYLEKYGFSGDSFVTDLDEDGVPKCFVKADTLDELAEICGIDKAGLLDTVARFNKFVEQGHDDDYNRGDSLWDRNFFSDMTQEGVYHALGSIEKGPFYATEMAPSTLGTCGGPDLNTKGQLMHATNVPIRRLYGCGNGVGYGGPGQGYCGSGATLGPGFTWGYIAACGIIENETTDWA